MPLRHPAHVEWSQATHKLSIVNTLCADASYRPDTASRIAIYTLDGDWRQSDFQIGNVASNSISGYWQVTTTNDSHSPGAPLCDRAYYLAKNPDVAASKVDPYQH